MNVDERSYTYVNTELVLYFCDYCTSSLFDSVWFYFFIGIHWNLFIFVFAFSCVYRGIGRILSRMEEELIQ